MSEHDLDRPAPAGPRYQQVADALARISARSSAARYTASLGSLSELVEHPRSTRLELLSTAQVSADARLLGVAPRSPGLQVLRTYVGAQDRTPAVSLNINPAHRFTLSTRCRLEWDSNPCVAPQPGSRSRMRS